MEVRDSLGRGRAAGISLYEILAEAEGVSNVDRIQQNVRLMSSLQRKREEFWDTQPAYGGAKGMSLKIAASA